MFTGRRFDSETALYYYRARYYAPDIGRLLQTDPIGYYGGLNLYTYVGNNPTNWIDPYGLGFWEWVHGLADAWGTASYFGMGAGGHGYIDINASIGYWGGITYGLMIAPDGVYVYFGGGFVSPPGGVAVTWSPSDPTPGWNAGVQGGIWGGGQGGYSFGEGGGWFGEGGFVTPGASVTGYYAWGPEGDKKGSK